MTDYGIKAGDNVETNTNQQLKLTTKYNSLKIFQKGDSSFTTNGSGDATATIPHNLDYPPAFVVFRKCTSQWTFLDASSYPNAYVPVGCPNYWGNSNDLHHALHAYSDDTNLYIQADGAKASTAYDFRYYLFVDRSEAFDGDFGGELSSDYGWKVTPSGISVLTAKEYELGYSSKYKALQYYGVHFETASLTLPAVSSSKYDNFEEEGTYVDFNHGLGYPPLFLAFYESSLDLGNFIQIPTFSVSGSTDGFNYMVSSFADATKVRISFWRAVYYLLTNESWAAETINIKLYIFTEDLTS